MRLSSTECGVTVAVLYLKQHMAWLHGICISQMREVNEVGVGPTIYLVSFPRVVQSDKCPVRGCPVVAHSAGQLRDNFMYRHIWLQVVVVQEGGGGAASL